MFRRPYAITLPFLLAALPVWGETLELKSGKVVIGRVVRVDQHTVEVDETYPGDGKRTIARGDIAPRSLYAILATRADPSNAEARQELAEEALRLGLPAHAIAELRLASRLDATLKAANEKRIQEIRIRMAADLVSQAEEALRQNRWAEAKLNADVVIDEYGDTPAAARARAMRERIMRAMRAASRTRRTQSAELAAALKKAGGHLKQAESVKLGAPLESAASSSRFRRQLERAIRFLEAAWRSVRDFAPEQAVEPELADRFHVVKEKIRNRLGAHYLSIGTVYLQRRAVPRAEEYNIRACELDPDSGGCRHLQALIVQARIISGR